MASLTARELIALVLDPDSWQSWDEPIVDPARPGTDYAVALTKARARTGVDEAVLTGTGRLRGRQVAVVASEFGFLGGSIGVVAGERLVRAVERATADGLPLLAAPASGGTRMQEGTVAFLQMVKISQAIAAHRTAGLPYLVYLRHPTTGGVFASWGSLGHVTVAEPGALIGFLGPKVYEALHGERFPQGVQTAENLYRHGLLDAVVPAHELADLAERALTVMCPGPAAGGSVAEPSDEPIGDTSAWESVRRSRRPDRPGVRRLLQRATDVLPLHGSGQGETAPGVLLALARFGAVPVVVLGQDRRNQTAEAPLDAGALRTAQRGMRLAAELRLPLVTVIDTPGAALSKEGEEGGLAGEIARCLAEMVTLDTPTLCVLLGQGSGGGALALVPADRVVAAEHAWLSPIPPEGGAAILYRDPGRAEEVAAAQGIRSVDLRASRIVDRIVAERPDAADEPEEFLTRLVDVIEDELTRLLAGPAGTRRAAREQRYRRLGWTAERRDGADD